ncbi:MAG: sulfatase-like hydrolase/transferase [candidate division Zixibacteria bacterium]|nr:sulfatase-like hydrolase/transferase [candidate division Zixibacteria bacterium]
MFGNLVKNIVLSSFAGLLGGVAAGLVECIIRASNLNHFEIDFFSAGIFVYSVLGLLLAVLYSTVILSGMKLFRMKGGIKYIEAVFFAASGTYLVYPAIKADIIPGFFAAESGPVVFVLKMSLLIFALLLILYALFRISARLSAKIGLRWWISGLIIYALMVIPGYTVYYGGESKMASFEDAVDSQESTDKKLPPVIFIIADALRADRLSCYGYNIDTPNIQALADDGVKFELALANCSWTRPSIASFMTSLNPLQHNVRTGNQSINMELTTFAEVMNSGGYFTMGVHNNPHIREMMNFDQGFDYYEYYEPMKLYPYPSDAPILKRQLLMNKIMKRFHSKSQAVFLVYQDASATSRHIINLLDQMSYTNYFLFIHYMDPHAPYYTAPYTGDAIDFDTDLTVENLDVVNGAYDAEIKRVDRGLGMLLEYLKSKGQYGQSLIIFTSDHGEEFYDHQGWGHGKTQYDEVLKIPLIIKFPNNSYEGLADTSLVESVDIAPTVTRYLDVPTPDSWTGKNIISNEETEWSLGETKGAFKKVLSLRSYDEKIHASYKGDHLTGIQYYNLAVDPKEQNDLAENPKYRDRAKELLKLMEEYVNRYTDKSYESGEINLDDETKERLKALGYLE